MATQAAIPASSSDGSTTPTGQSSKAKFCWGQGTVAGALSGESKDGSDETSVVVSLADVMSEQLASQIDGELKCTRFLDSEIPDPDWDPGLAQAIRESLESTQTDHSTLKLEQSSSAEGATASGGAGLDTNPTDDIPDTSSDELLALLLQEGFDAEFQARKCAKEQQLSKKRHSVSGSPPKEGKTPPKEGKTPPKEGKEKRFLDHSFNSFKKATRASVEKASVEKASVEKASVENGWMDQHSDHSTSPESFEDPSDGKEQLVLRRGCADECEGDLEEDHGRDRGRDSDSDRDRDWDRFEGEERTRQTLNKRGFALGKDGKVSLTKHDSTLCARRNACKVMEFNTQIHTGDGAGFDMKLSNNVYNALRKHVVAEEKR